MALAERHAALLARVGRVESVRILGTDDDAPNSATALLDDMRLLVPMAGLIDVDAERQRLGKLEAKVAGDLKKAEGKLGNANFVNNAPEAVVTQERDRVSEFVKQLAQIREQLEKLDTIA